jgi:hypothetical protein
VGSITCVWGTARCYCGQYNLWLHIRYGGASNKTEDGAGRMIVSERAIERVRERDRQRQREKCGSDSGEPTDFSCCNVHRSLTYLEGDVIAIFRNVSA